MGGEKERGREKEREDAPFNEVHLKSFFLAFIADSMYMAQ
jgi:hypothetical protein